MDAQLFWTLALGLLFGVVAFLFFLVLVKKGAFDQIEETKYQIFFDEGFDDSVKGKKKCNDGGKSDSD